MPGILGNRAAPRRSILGGFHPIRQYAEAQGGPVAQPQASPFAMMGGGQGVPPAYGSDEWALQTGGPGAMIMREVARAMTSGKNPLEFLIPSKAGKFFSPASRSILGGEYAAGGKKKVT